MTPHHGGGRRLGDVLEARRAFVGRAAELELLRSALDAEELPFHVLFVHGPGGIGKTSLLREMERVATAAGRTPIRVDARDGAPSPEGVLAALAAALGVDGDPLPAVPDRAVLLVDTYEEWEAVDSWLRESLLPALPADVVVVIGGRRAPGPAWRAGPLGSVVRVVALRNLDPDLGRELAERLVTDKAAGVAIAEQAYGHPLGIALLAEVANAGGAVVDEAWSPYLVEQLLSRFIRVVPSARHRRALDTLALARVTTEETLRGVFPDEDVHDLFLWLRGLTFVQAGPEGLFPHDLAREALEADLKWRDRAGLRDLTAGLQKAAFARYSALRGRAQQRALIDAQYSFTRVPVLRDIFDWDSFGLLTYAPATPADGDALLGLFDAAGEPESAALARHWWRYQPEAFWLVRDSNHALRGVLVFVILTRAPAEAIAQDPLASALWEHVARTAPLAPGETLGLCHDMLDSVAGMDRRSGTTNLGIALGTQLLFTDRLSCAVTAVRTPEPWEAAWQFMGFPRAPGLTAEVDGREVGFFLHDFRDVPTRAWSKDFGKRIIDVVTDSSAARTTAPVALSRTDFADAVKAALRDLHRPDALARNPLVASSLVGDGPDPAAALRDVVVAAVRRLGEDPRSEKHHRALDRTYLRPASTQERAAEVLGLPFSTYRRHLTEGIARVVADLWRRELSPPS